jgi:hypothetical protein
MRRRGAAHQLPGRTRLQRTKRTGDFFPALSRFDYHYGNDIPKHCFDISKYGCISEHHGFAHVSQQYQQYSFDALSE